MEKTNKTTSLLALMLCFSSVVSPKSEPSKTPPKETTKPGPKFQEVTDAGKQGDDNDGDNGNNGDNGNDDEEGWSNAAMAINTAITAAVSIGGTHLLKERWKRIAAEAAPGTAAPGTDTRRAARRVQGQRQADQVPPEAEDVHV